MSGFTGTWTELYYNAQGPAGAYNTSTTRTAISPPGPSGTGPAPLLPVNFFGPNYSLSAIKVVARGILSTTTGPPTFTWALAYDTTAGTFGTQLAATGAVTTTASVTDYGWEMEVDIIRQSIYGTSATVNCQGVLTLGAMATTTAASAYAMGPANAAVPTATINTTTSTPYIELFGTWSASSASNSVTCYQYTIFGLN